MRGLLSILSIFRNDFIKFNNTGARMLDFTYHMTLKLVENRILGRENVNNFTFNATYNDVII